MAETIYEDDVDIVGTVLAVDVKSNRFTIYPDPQNGEGIEVEPYPADREPLITEALHDHRSLRLRIKGRGEFSGPERKLCRIHRAEKLTLEVAKPESGARPNHRPIWEEIAEIADRIPEEELDKIPHDASVNLDHYLYGSPKR